MSFADPSTTLLPKRKPALFEFEKGLLRGILRKLSIISTSFRTLFLPLLSLRAPFYNISAAQSSPFILENHNPIIPNTKKEQPLNRNCSLSIVFLSIRFNQSVSSVFATVYHVGLVGHCILEYIEGVSQHIHLQYGFLRIHRF